MELDQHEDDVPTREWWASIRLATAFSIVAALGALLLAGHVPETTIVVSIIAIGTMLSWFHLEDAPTAATVRHPRRHRR